MCSNASLSSRYNQHSYSMVISIRWNIILTGYERMHIQRVTSVSYPTVPQYLLRSEFSRSQLQLRPLRPQNSSCYSNAIEAPSHANSSLRQLLSSLQNPGIQHIVTALFAVKSWNVLKQPLKSLDLINFWGCRLIIPAPKI